LSAQKRIEKLIENKQSAAHFGQARIGEYIKNRANTDF
jgi:hypothetical protein